MNLCKHPRRWRYTFESWGCMGCSIMSSQVPKLAPCEHTWGKEGRMEGWNSCPLCGLVSNAPLDVLIEIEETR